MSEEDLIDLRKFLHKINDVDENTPKKAIKALACKIMDASDDWQNIDRPLYDDARYLAEMKYGTRKEIMILVNRIRKGLQGLIDYAESD